MSAAASAPVHRLQPDERARWTAVLADWPLLCLAVARLLHGMLTGHLPGTEATDHARLPALVAYLVRAATRLRNLIARIEAGIPPPPPRPGDAPAGRGGGAGKRQDLSLTAMGYAGLEPVRVAACHLLMQRDLGTLLARDPRVGRILRPLCRVLGIRMDGYVYPEDPEPAEEPAAEPPTPVPAWPWLAVADPEPDQVEKTG